MSLWDSLTGGPKSNDEMRARLVAALKSNGYVSSASGERAMLAVRRELFMPSGLVGSAYADRPQPIGHGQTISAPHMVAIMVEAHMLEPGLRVLEVGAGSGYHAAVTAHMVVESLVGSKSSGSEGSAGEEEGEQGAKDRGHVYTVEYVPELAGAAEANLERAGLSSHVTVICGDGSLGLPEHAPYDRIFVACAAPGVPPPLVEQLDEGGVLLIPVGKTYYSELTRLTKRKGKLISEELGGCSFVPLVGEHGV
jgi:protein-L-isoaspartate(D-aspartate) O-methyltransferase